MPKRLEVDTEVGPEVDPETCREVGVRDLRKRFWAANVRSTPKRLEVGTEVSAHQAQGIV